MTWFAFKGLNGGQAVDLAGTQEKQAVAEGFHGYATQAQAQASPNSVNLVTQVLADAWITDYKAAVAEQAQPGGKNATITNPATAASAAVTGVATEAGDLAGLPGLLSALTSEGTWLRVAKVVVGSVMIIVGLVKLTGTGRAVTTAAKGAIL